MNLCFHVVVDTGEVKALTDTFVSVLQVVLSYKCHMHLLGGVTLLFKEVVPRLHSRCLTYWDTNLSQDGGIETLPLHVDGHFVNRGHVFTLHHAFQIDITKRCHLHAQGIVEVAFCT